MEKDQITLNKELNMIQELENRTHVMFNKPFKIAYFYRQDGKPLAASDPQIRQKVFREDQEAHGKGEKINVLLKIDDIKEASQISELRRRGGLGEIRFHPDLMWQLLMILFEQAGLTTVVVDSAPEPAKAAV